MALCHFIESTEIICALPVPHTQNLGYVLNQFKNIAEAIRRDNQNILLNIVNMPNQYKFYIGG